jgi:hypothetical protein
MPDDDVIETEPPDPGLEGRPSRGQVGAALQEQAEEHAPSEPLLDDEPGED